ncbi:putative expressed protein [Lyophyllum shimeji]|uniref:Expressed protein n=1 Tax=Lyophyllum shimeji TaxID=47721 RepID=A0A9P3PXU7_LYOSH|nr:putative expressed protein [Lyophyllum shimeji]
MVFVNGLVLPVSSSTAVVTNLFLRLQPLDHRLQGARDTCKQKKIKCDSSIMPGNRCTNCITAQLECTHRGASVNNKAFSPWNPKGPAPQLGILPPDPQAALHPLLRPMVRSFPSLALDIQLRFKALSQHAFNLEWELSNMKDRDSSAPVTSSSSTRETSQESQPGDPTVCPPDHDEVDIADQETRQNMRSPDETFHFRRSQFWNSPWESARDETFSPMYEFPDHQLLLELVGIFFDQVNPFYPLLHRPTYEKAVKAQDVSERPSIWGDSPWVLLDGVDSHHSAGWKWFCQIPRGRRLSARTLSLCEIQTLCLSILFRQTSSQPEICWSMIGTGIRFAQEVGVHRKKPTHTPTIEDELWKRCFWILVCMDAMLCSFLGRPRATTFDDFNLPLPLDRDDEYWEMTEPASDIAKPASKPSQASYFIAYIKLIEILDYAQQTLYAVDQLKRSRGPTRGQSNESVVAHLDSELNQWFEHVPDHLKWGSITPESVFYDQSAMLHASYNHIRILVHRPFIATPKNLPPPPFPSLAICAHAARTCAHILKSQSQQGTTYLPFAQVQSTVFISAVVLLLNYWTCLKSSKQPRDSVQDLESVQDCLFVLSRLEERWWTAGRMRDVIHELASYGHVPFPLSAEGRNANSGDAGPSGAPDHTPDQVGTSETFQNSTWSWQDFAQDAIQSTPGPSTSSLDGALGSEFWSYGAQDAPALTQPLAELAPLTQYIHQAQDNTQWPLTMPTGMDSMDFSDAAMPWLQQPQSSGAWVWDGAHNIWTG